MSANNTTSATSLDRTVASRDHSMPPGETARRAVLARPKARMNRKATVLIAEVALTTLSYFLSVWVLYDSGGRGPLLALRALPVVLALRSACLYWLGPFRSSLRHASIHELIAIAKAITLST